MMKGIKEDNLNKNVAQIKLNATAVKSTAK